VNQATVGLISPWLMVQIHSSPLSPLRGQYRAFFETFTPLQDLREPQVF
jgi:hypothetical protein